MRFQYPENCKRKQSVSNWENDNIMPSVETLKKAADFFHVSTDYLLGRTDDLNSHKSPELYSRLKNTTYRDFEPVVIAAGYGVGFVYAAQLRGAFRRLIGLDAISIRRVWQKCSVMGIRRLQIMNPAGSAFSYVLHSV